MINTTQIKDCIYYYKSTIADSQKIEADYDKFNKKNQINIEQVKNGLIDITVANHMFKVSGTYGDSMNIIICPVTMNANSEHGVMKKLPKCAVPLMVPAKLKRDGSLERQSPYVKPWIARKYLKPTKIERYAVGDIDKLDDYYNKDDFRYCNKWDEYWEYAEKLVQYVTDRSIEEFQLTDYTKVDEAYIIKDDLMLGTTIHLLRFYETMLETKDIAFGPLVKNIKRVDYL